MRSLSMVVMLSCYVECYRHHRATSTVNVDDTNATKTRQTDAHRAKVPKLTRAKTYTCQNGRKKVMGAGRVTM